MAEELVGPLAILYLLGDHEFVRVDGDIDVVNEKGEKAVERVVLVAARGLRASDIALAVNELEEQWREDDPELQGRTIHSYSDDQGLFKFPGWGEEVS